MGGIRGIRVIRGIRGMFICTASAPQRTEAELHKRKEGTEGSGGGGSVKGG